MRSIVRARRFLVTFSGKAYQPDPDQAGRNVRRVTGGGISADLFAIVLASCYGSPWFTARSRGRPGLPCRLQGCLPTGGTSPEGCPKRRGPGSCG